MVDVVITLPSTVETLQYRLGRATPTISQPRKPRKKAKASTIAFIFPCFFSPTRVELSKDRNTLFKCWLSKLSSCPNVRFCWPHSLSVPDQFPATPELRCYRKLQINDWFQIAHLWFPLLFSSLLNLFKGSKCLPNLKGNREVKSSLQIGLLTSIDLMLFVTFWHFLLNTMSIISKCYWWGFKSRFGLSLHPVSRGW